MTNQMGITTTSSHSSSVEGVHAKTTLAQCKLCACGQLKNEMIFQDQIFRYSASIICGRYGYAKSVLHVNSGILTAVITSEMFIARSMFP